MESLTQKSHRSDSSHVALAMVKAAIIKACHENSWKGGAFSNIKTVSSDLDIDLERLEVYSRTTEAERAVFRDTRLKVADVRAYLEGRPSDLSSVDDLGWVKRLKSVFEGQTTLHQEAEVASTKEKEMGGPETKPVSSEGDEHDGFERQKLYGGRAGPPKD